MPQGSCGNPCIHARCSWASSTDTGIFAALKHYPPKDWTPSPLPTVTPAWPPQTPTQPGPLQGKPGHGGKGQIFQGHAQGLRQGRLGEREKHHHPSWKQGEEPGKVKSPHGRSWGAAMGQGPGKEGSPPIPPTPASLILPGI